MGPGPGCLQPEQSQSRRRDPNGGMTGQTRPKEPKRGGARWDSYVGLKSKEEGRAPTTAVTILVIGTGQGGEVEAAAIEGLGLPSIVDGTNPPENRPMGIGQEMQV